MIYNLDKVRISPRVFQTWVITADSGMKGLRQKYPGLLASDVPDERFRLLPDGTGEIFVKVKAVSIRMRVPKDEFVIDET